MRTRRYTTKVSRGSVAVGSWLRPSWPARCATIRPTSRMSATRAAITSETAQLTAVTRDHTIAGEQNRQGLISSEEAEASEAGHVLSRALGPELYVTADSTTVSLRAGDFLVLCCDGVYAGVDASAMVQILAQPKPPQVLAEELVSHGRRQRRLRQHNGPGHRHSLGGSDGDVPRTPLPAAGVR